MDWKASCLLADVRWYLWCHNWKKADKKMRQLINHVVKEELEVEKIDG